MSMPDFCGTYMHTVDAKGRTFVPAKLREQLGDEIVLVIVADKCVSVYSQEQWEVFKEKIVGLPPIKAREIKRRIFPLANSMTIDIQGRILIPQNLRDKAELTKNIVSIGVGDHVEIWSDTNYEAMQSAISDAELAETLIELGM